MPKPNDTVDLHLRCPPDLAAWVKKKAEDEGRTIQGQIVFLLKICMNADKDA